MKICIPKLKKSPIRGFVFIFLRMDKNGGLKVKARHQKLILRMAGVLCLYEI